MHSPSSGRLCFFFVFFLLLHFRFSSLPYPNTCYAQQYYYFNTCSHHRYLRTLLLDRFFFCQWYKLLVDFVFIRAYDIADWKEIVDDYGPVYTLTTRIQGIMHFLLGYKLPQETGWVGLMKITHFYCSTDFQFWPNICLQKTTLKHFWIVDV